MSILLLCLLQFPASFPLTPLHYLLLTPIPLEAQAVPSRDTLKNVDGPAFFFGRVTAESPIPYISPALWCFLFLVCFPPVGLPLPPPSREPRQVIDMVVLFFVRRNIVCLG